MNTSHTLQSGQFYRPILVTGVIGFIFAFSFLLSPKEARAESCLGNVDPKSYIETYLKTQQRDTNVDIAKLATELLGVEISENVSLSDAIDTVYSSSKAAVCFQNKEYWKGFNILGEAATKISFSKIATAITDYSPVTWPAAVVDIGLNILRNKVNETAINNIVSNYKLALEPNWCKTDVDQCHQRIVECSELSISNHNPWVCFSDGYEFRNGWLTYPKPSNQTFDNPYFPFGDSQTIEGIIESRKKFYAGAKAIYQEQRIAEQIVQQNEQAAAGLINTALKTIENNPKTATANSSSGGFFSNLWKSIKDFFTSPKETEIKPSDLSGQVSNAIPENKTGEISTTQQPTNISKAIGITVKTYGQVDQRAYELAKTETEKTVSCLAPAIKERLLSNNLTIMVIPSDSSIVDLPELSNLKGTRNEYGVLQDVEDGIFAGNLIVTKESDFIHHSGKVLSDLGIEGGGVLRHELGHSIETLGFSDDERLELKLAYQEYKNKTNPEIDVEGEYFAERTPEYFEYIVPRFPLTAELLRRVYPCIALELDRGKTVRAVIVDSSSAPLRSLPFSISSARPSNFEFQYKGVTDGNGAIEVTSLIPGRYTLTIQDPFPSQDPQSTREQLPYSSTKFDITDTDIDLGKIYQESFFGNNYPTIKEPNISIDGAITAAYLVSPVKFILSWDVPLEQRNNGCVLRYHDLKEEKQINIYNSDKLEISSSDNTMEMTYAYSLTCGDKKKEVTLYLRRR